MQRPADASGSDRLAGLPTGHRVGRWEVTGPIGAGGWGTVHAARPADGDAGAGPGPRDVALKLLPTGGLGPLQARRVAESARREVELGRRAPHSRLIRLLDSFVLSEPGHPHLDGAIVLVMERAAHSLRDLLGTALPEAEGARLIREICEGLAHLHRSGWVHGDLKPDNVLIMADGSVRLADFGLATELTGTHGTHGYAPPMGTPDYLPPERWRAPFGELGVQVRPSADVWALGVLVHEVFAGGAAPFPGATPVSRGAAVQEYADGRAPLRMDHAVPPFWRELAADCLAPTHAARAPHTAESLLARIAARPDPAAGEGAAPVAGPPARPAPRPPAPRRRKARAALAAGAACGAAAGLWSYAGPGGPSGGESGTGAQAPGRIRVFNAEKSCREPGAREPQCSLGLAVDPLKAYAPDNVIPTRVWHGEVLAVDCLLPRGMPIVDESDAVSLEWYRVRLPEGSDRATAWLPAVRTKDRPAVPECPRPTATATGG
ncbi:serine/threonine-protein kinase [Streptomyces sp. NPDC059982]|uniref:serine/threonine-protein kinase n=2 Tax=unclassified Streptomyces TaxID=2593676 RepID=UPI0036A1B3D8